MGVPSIGDVIVVDFPFTEGGRLKRRPALVVARSTRGDSVVSYITSRPQPDAVLLPSTAVHGGSLPIDSYVRPEKLYTVGPSAIARSLGRAEDTVVDEVLSTLRRLFTR